ncbi:MAG TPA: hypothetical protein VK779_01460 [Rhizomicrobium sp.]|jgi:hypothetical protein|nr:hypothetical protein [Rhizomicrobium sp.]
MAHEPDTGEPDSEDSETLGGALGRIFGSILTIFILFAIVAAVLWFLLR